MWSIAIHGKGRTSNATPLHTLCGCSLSEIHLNDNGEVDVNMIKRGFELLIVKGCDINAIDDAGKTPLHYSVTQRHHTLSMLLLENEANPTIRDNEDDTALHLVWLNKSSGPLIEALLAHGADINAKRHQDGRTPLHTMLAKSSSKIYPKVLLQFVKNWNVEDSEGNTPLHLFISKKGSFGLD